MKLVHLVLPPPLPRGKMRGWVCSGALMNPARCEVRTGWGAHPRCPGCKRDLVSHDAGSQDGEGLDA